MQKKRIVQKLWGWICLAVNCFVVFLYLAEQREELLGVGILSSALTICYGVLKTHLDKLKGDTSLTSVVIEYVCLYIITFLLGLKATSDLSSLSVLIALAITSLFKICIFLLITYWCAIRQYFFRGNKEKKK